ncbi:endolytic transglycosylase MltG [Rhodovibrionaceae bacterium A322]
MRRVLWLGLVLLILGGLVAGGGFVYLKQTYVAPGPLAEDTTLVIVRGRGLTGISEQLTEAGVVRHALLFQAAARLEQRTRSLQAGEFVFPAGVSIAGVLDILESGKTVVRRLTVPEGLTSAEVVALVARAKGLKGELDHVPEQGALLPETYHYTWGDRRSDLLQRMDSSMQQLLAESWEQRQEGLPISSPQDALILASIVEKETGLDGERPLVASVFLNRLRRGMRLQSDPTVVFALTNGKRPLGRALTRADWKYDNPYNTYVIKGLPPGPIANPGRAAIEAVLNPAESDYIYFVADGLGGHAFAKTLKEHNRNVAKWRKLKRSSD